LRIGTATANAWRTALGTKLIPVVSLEALYAGQKSDKPHISVMSAGRGNFFVCVRAEQALVSQLVTSEALINTISLNQGISVVTAAESAEEFKMLTMENECGDLEIITANEMAVLVGELAITKLQTESFRQPLEPFYLRNPDIGRIPPKAV
jgi:tRNA A37 threonylcarbamoyladenosine modification protein TsaB